MIKSFLYFFFLLRHLRQVPDLLNEAALSTDGQRKVKILAELKELLLNRAPDLCDQYFEELLAFQNDTTPDVRRTALTVFEEAWCALPVLGLRT